MPRIICLLLAVMALLSPSHPAKATEEARYTAIVILDSIQSFSELDGRSQLRDLVGFYMLQDQFEMLEGIAYDFRINQTRSPSGLPNLAYFYQAMRWMIENDQYISMRALGELARPDGKWDVLADKLDRWAAGFPESTAPGIIRAVMMQVRAEASRSTGWVNANPGFTDRTYPQLLRELRDYLTAEEGRLSVDPHWHLLRLKVAVALGEEATEILAIIDRATMANPSYYPIYFEALDYLMPGGETKTANLEAWASQATAALPPAEGDILYMRIYWYAIDAFEDTDLLTESEIDWPRFRRGMEAVAADYPDPWNVNNFALFACLAGDQQATRVFVDRLSGVPLRRVWNFDAVFHMCREFANFDPGGPANASGGRRTPAP